MDSWETKIKKIISELEDVHELVNSPSVGVPLEGCIEDLKELIK